MDNLYTVDELLELENDALAELTLLLPAFAERKLDELTAAAITYADANGLSFPHEEPPAAAIPAEDEAAVQAANERARNDYHDRWRHIFAYGIGAGKITIHVDDDTDNFVISFI